MVEQQEYLRAVRSGATEAVAAFLVLGVRPDEVLDSDLHHTALHIAAKAGNGRMCEALIASGASMSATDVYANTPLHLAATEGNAEVCQLLLKHGANPSARRATGSTPLIAAVSPKSEAAEVIRLLLKHGADINAVNRQGDTALNTAISMGCMQAARTLLEEGANPNLTTGSAFYTPLRNALYTVVGADPDKTLDEEIESKLMLLLEFGADPSYTPPGRPLDYLTPLQSAVATRCRAAVELFCQRAPALLDFESLTVCGLTLEMLCGPDPGLIRWLQSLRVERAIRLSIDGSPEDACANGTVRSTIEASPL